MSGLDPSFEQTVQVFDLVSDSGLSVLTTNLLASFDPVPGGQNWLVERISGRYRPGLVPTDSYVPLRVFANAVGSADLREGVELAPVNGWFAGIRFDFFADEATPVRFFAGEQINITAPSYADATNKSRLTVILQIRAVKQLPGAGEGDTTPVEEVDPKDKTPEHDPTWG